MIVTLAALTILGTSPFIENRKPIGYEAFLTKVATVSQNTNETNKKRLDELKLEAMDFKDATDFFVVDTQTARTPDGKIKTELIRVMEWLQKMAKPDFAQKLTQANWVAYKDVSHPVEPIIAQVEYADMKIAWSFGKKTVAVVVDLGHQNDLVDSAEVNKFSIDLLNDLLTLPERPKDSVRSSLKEYGGLWAGYVNRGLFRRPNGDENTPFEWDCNFLVITDGRYALIRWGMRVPEDLNPGIVSDGPSSGSYKKTKSRFDPDKK